MPRIKTYDVDVNVIGTERLVSTNINNGDATANILVSDIKNYVQSETGATDLAISNWNTAFAWGDHSVQGYLTNVGISDLTATGTKDNTTFLRGDNVWAVPAGGGGGVFTGTVTTNEIVTGAALDELQGTNQFTWDGTQVMIHGSSADRYIRFGESTGFFNGAFLWYEGLNNQFHIGVHTAADTNPAGDTKVITIPRANGRVGIKNTNPSFDLDVTGVINCTGAQINATDTKFAGRISTNGVSGFGGSRLGDSMVQTPTLDIGTTLNFMTTAQTTQWAWFANASGNTMTMRHVQNPTALLSIQNNAADVVLGVNDVESTLGLVTQYSTGDPHVYDLFNQNYVADGSVIAIAQGVNMIAPVADHRPYVIARSETGLTNITTMLEIDGASLTTQIATWGIDVVTQGSHEAESYQVTALNTAPASASATGTVGEVRYTADYIYVCVATDTWKRTAIDTWV